MTNADAKAPAERGIGVRGMEVGTSAILALIGAAAIWDSLRIGAGWSKDGPQSGYFPFWIGVLLVGAALTNIIRVARSRAMAEEAALFLTWSQARTVTGVLAPLTAYVAAIFVLGIYLASACLVVWFMTRLGEFRLRSAVPAGIATAIVTFVIFEIWFLVALPKGPIETALGF